MDHSTQRLKADFTKKCKQKNKTKNLLKYIPTLMLINKRLFHFSLLKKEQNDLKCRKQTSQGRTFFEKVNIKMNQDKAPRSPFHWSCWTDPSGTLAQVKESAGVKATTVWLAPSAMLSHLAYTPLSLP